MKKSIIAIGVLAVVAWTLPAAYAGASAGVNASASGQTKAQQKAAAAAKKRAERLDEARANAALAGSANVDADARRALRGG
jgi:hypothetical protein